jgi:hypothetical protein
MLRTAVTAMGALLGRDAGGFSISVEQMHFAGSGAVGFRISSDPLPAVRYVHTH